MSDILKVKSGNNTWVGIPAIQGPAGASGSNGVGVPSGGTAGQFLVKQSATDYDTAWVTVPNANGVSF